MPGRISEVLRDLSDSAAKIELVELGLSALVRTLGLAAAIALVAAARAARRANVSRETFTAAAGAVWDALG